jgi:hypothetical protein
MQRDDVKPGEVSYAVTSECLALPGAGTEQKESINGH